MLVKFEIDPSHPAPQHVKEWIRFQVLKQIDDFRLGVLQSISVDLTGDALEMLKIAFLCKFGRPKFNTFGKVVSYDNVILAFDVPKEIIEAEYNNFIEDLKLSKPVSYYEANHYDQNTKITRPLNPPTNIVVPPKGNGDYFVDTVSNPLIPETLSLALPNTYVWTWNMLSDHCYDLDKIISKFIFDKQSKKWYLPRPTTRINIATSDGISRHSVEVAKIVSDKTKGTISYSIEHNFKSKLFQTYKWYFEFINKEFGPSFVSSYDPNRPVKIGSATLPWPKISHRLYPLLFQELSNLRFRNLADNTSNRLSVVTPQEGIQGFLTKEPGDIYRDWVGTDKFFPHRLNFNRVTLSAPRFDNISIFELNQTAPLIIDGQTYLFGDMNIAAINPLTAMNGKESGGVAYFINETLSSGDKYYYGNYRVRSGLLYADATKNFDVEYIEYPESILNILEKIVNHQNAIQELINDNNSGMYRYATASFTYKYANYVNIHCSSFTDTDGSTTLLRHPTEGFPMSVTYYLAELRWLSITEIWKAEAAISNFLESRRVRNEQAFQDAYQKFLRSEAQAKGTESIAEYELKLKTGVFFLENGISYWRPFTEVESEVINELKAQAEANIKIIEQNKIIEAQNKAALDAVNAKVIAENNAKIEMATNIAKEEVMAEMRAKADALVVPTIIQLIQRAKELEMNAPETLEKWIQEHPYLVLNPSKAAQVEKLMAQIKDLEAKVATTLVVDTISEARFTQSLKELFKVV
jgi:hypothetical protein